MVANSYGYLADLADLTGTWEVGGLANYRCVNLIFASVSDKRY